MTLPTYLGVPGETTFAWIFNEGSSDEDKYVIHADTISVALAIWRQNGIPYTLTSVRAMADAE